MKLLSKKAFGNPKALWLDKLIAVVSLGNISHTELQFSNGECFSASWHGVRFRKAIDTSDNRCWIVTEIYGVDEAKARVEANKLIGQRYDKRGAVLSPLRICRILFFKQDENSGFCSEVCANVIAKASDIKIWQGCKVSPYRLTKLFRK